MPSKDKNPAERVGHLPNTVTRKILIAKLVPSERVLDQDAVKKAKRSISSGNTKPPRVVRIGRYYYVRNGNHRIMAAKLRGLRNIDCRIEARKRRPNVSDFEEDDCKEAVKLGYLGFSKVSVTSKKEKDQAYDEEEELLF